MSDTHHARARNPFRELMVTELIENPKLYKKLFSEKILIGETLSVFRPANTVLTGPQGSGKSMILNFLRHSVLAEYLIGEGLHEELSFLTPFLGISVNLQRAYFQAFGRRSAARPPGSDPDVDASCAADYLNHLLFGEFLKGIIYILSPQGAPLAKWMGVSRSRADASAFASEISKWRCWYGYYANASTLDKLVELCNDRLDSWRRFLNTTSDAVPENVWDTKTTIGEPLHFMGTALQTLIKKGRIVPLYVVIDQYEVLPELNVTHGTLLQRVVNTLIKAREPVVFYRIGARTYDWGRELRVWGAESRIELQRDYILVDLAEALMRNENTGRSIFRNLASDVATKRLLDIDERITPEDVGRLFGRYSPDTESRSYFGKKKKNINQAVGKVPKDIAAAVETACGAHASPLDLRLAGAWALQNARQGESLTAGRSLAGRPWAGGSWKKERIVPALCQIASIANEKKRYAGWPTIVDLSGANIAAFLLLASEIWDLASKLDHKLTDDQGKTVMIPPELQTDAIRQASLKWVQRDRLETTGGSKRYSIISRLGPAIHDAIIADQALSNPGHSGFSLRETDIQSDPNVQAFLQNGVSWAILEERQHTSRNRGDSGRRKFCVLSARLRRVKCHAEPACARLLAGFTRMKSLSHLM